MKKEWTEPTPKTSKTLAIIKYTEAFSDFLSSVIVTRTVLLQRVTRDKDDPNSELLPMMDPNSSYSEEYVSVENEILSRVSYD